MPLEPAGKRPSRDGRARRDRSRGQAVRPEQKPYRQGRSPRRPIGKGVRWFSFLLFIGVEAAALLKLALRTDWLTVCGYLAVVSFVTIALYRDDKSGSRIGAWRTSESLLHGLELIGGWPAAFVAQQVFHHKTVKLSYQLIFWLIGLLHLFIAIDYLRGWAVLRGAFAGLAD